ncbi:MAG: LacI family DNA-binding transcriptional regulator [Anaerolineales bacterium]|nr:LacI family DNA-binding transcriptional regulator [Anaerolineales bacterium]
MPVTLKDIAKKVGKSTTTVSRALGDYDDISPETKALVRQAVADLGYKPSVLARRLQKQRTDMLGFILPTFGPRFSDPFFSEFLAGIGNTAARHDLDLLVSTQPPGDAEMEAYKNKAQSRLVDGFIIVRTRKHDPRIEYLCGIGFPFVSFGREDDHQKFPFVDEDGEWGMRILIEYLLGLGHRRVGVITPPMDLMFTHFRLMGVRSKLAEANLALDNRLVVHGDLTQRGGYQMASNLLDQPDPPSAIVAFNDLMAFGAMSAVQERGLVVGKDISVTGFDDIPMAEHSHPPLTTLHQPIYQIGEILCEMLIQLISKGELEEERIILRPELIIRQSCGPAAGA